MYLIKRPKGFSLEFIRACNKRIHLLEEYLQKDYNVFESETEKMKIEIAELKILIENTLQYLENDSYSNLRNNNS